MQNNISQALDELRKIDAKDVDEISGRLHDFSTMMAYYRCAVMEIETKFNVLNEEFSLQYDRNPINGMKSRLKSLPSILLRILIAILQRIYSEILFENSTSES